MKTPKINRFFLDQSFLCRNYMLKKNDENVIIELKKELLEHSNFIYNQTSFHQILCCTSETKINYS